MPGLSRVLSSGQNDAMSVSRKKLPWLAVAALAMASAVCAQDGKRGASWPIYRGDSSLSGVAPGTIGTDLKLAWTFETEGPILSSPVVADGTVFFGSSDQSVYAVDLRTGEKRWSFETGDLVDAPPLILNGKVYIGSADYFFYCLDAATGALVWKYETDDQILGSANWTRLPDGSVRILVGSYDYKLYCFDEAKGEKVWEYETDDRVNGTPAILGDRVVFGGCDAVLHQVSIATGERVARVPLGPGCHIAGSVALAGGKAYFGHYGNAFVCIDTETGELDWFYADPTHPFFSSPAIGTDRVVFGGRDRQLHCVRRSDGEPLWTFPTRRKVDGSPVIVGDKVVFGSGDGRLYILDLESGKEVWKYEIGQGINSSAAVVDGMILIGSDDGRLYAFRVGASG